MTNQPPIEERYRWYMLGLSTITNALVTALPVMCMSVLFKEISIDLGLTLTQVGLIWGIGSLPGIVTTLLGGAIGDRFGPQRVLTLVCLFGGLAGASRGLSTNAFTLALTVVLFGFVSPMVPMNTIKVTRIWFSSRQLGLANGVTSMGMAAGFMLGALISASVVSPALGGWRNVLFLYGGLAMLLSIPWYFARPEPAVSPTGLSTTPTQSIPQMIRAVSRVPNIWFLGWAMLGIGGAIQGTLGYLPLYLRAIGWEETAADVASSSFHLVSMICVIPIALWSDRLGQRRWPLIVMALMIATGFGLLSVVEGVLVLAAVCLAGMVRDGYMAVFITMIAESDGIGALAGTATGFVMIFSGIGNLIAPPIGNSLAEISPSLPFVFWAAMALLGIGGLYAAKDSAAEEARPVSVKAAA
ncbi:nitrate/nitrite transporter [Chloroflexota bacterium]